MSRKQNKINTSPPPEKDHDGDFWARVQAKYEKAVDTWIEQGVEVPATRVRKAQLEGASEAEVIRVAKKAPKPKPEAPAGPGRGSNKAPEYDVDLAVARYQAGDTVKEIAADFGCDPRTIVSYLTKNQVYQPGRDVVKGARKSAEARKQDVCGRGHDMAIHGRAITRKGPNGEDLPGGRYCDACRKIRAAGGKL